MICSKNRPELLRQLLNSLNLQTDPSTINVHVVLNLDDYERFVNDVYKSQSNYNLTFSRTTKGTAAARNVGIDQIEKCDVVHFIDDDVMIPLDYFKTVETLFESGRNFIGGAGRELRIETKPAISSKKIYSLVSNGLDFSYKAGKLTKSATNFWVSNDLESRAEIEVDWLPGCAMFFNWHEVLNVRFNENLELGPLKGYAIGEDVDYTYRITRLGKLLYFPELTYDHFFAPNIARKSSIKLSYAQGQFKAYLKNSYPEYFSSIKIIVAHIFQHLSVKNFGAFMNTFKFVAFFTLGFLRERFKKLYSQPR